MKAGGVGLNLTEANHVFHFDLWWNPATAMQAEDRVHRLGQEKNVFVQSLLTEGTIEEDIQRMLERKRMLFADVVGGLSRRKVQTSLSEEELFGLFGLESAKGKGQQSRASTNSPAEVDDWAGISPQQFEDLVAKLYEQMGYVVRNNAYSRDGGVDLYVKRRTTGGQEAIAVQCKHYPAGTVGVKVARELFGVLGDDQRLTQGIVVTSGKFSRDCEAFVRGKRIRLMNGSYLRGLLERYQLSPKDVLTR